MRLFLYLLFLSPLFSSCMSTSSHKENISSSTIEDLAIDTTSQFLVSVEGDTVEVSKSVSFQRFVQKDDSSKVEIEYFLPFSTEIEISFVRGIIEHFIKRKTQNFISDLRKVYIKFPELSPKEYSNLISFIPQELEVNDSLISIYFYYSEFINDAAAPKKAHKSFTFNLKTRDEYRVDNFLGEESEKDILKSINQQLNVEKELKKVQNWDFNIFKGNLIINFNPEDIGGYKEKSVRVKRKL